MIFFSIQGFTFNLQLILFSYLQLNIYKQLGLLIVFTVKKSTDHSSALN